MCLSSLLDERSHEIEAQYFGFTMRTKKSMLTKQGERELLGSCHFRLLSTHICFVYCFISCSLVIVRFAQLIAFKKSKHFVPNYFVV